MEPPKDLLNGSFEDHIRGWPSIGVKVSPQMKAHVIEALHEEGWTLSLSEYLRVIVARHVADVLEMSTAEVLHAQPMRGTRKGTRYMRVT